MCNIKKFYAIYTMSDELVTVIEDKEELMRFFKRKNKYTLHNIISCYLRGKTKSIIVDGKHYKIYKMEDNENSN